jgi:hypothetical protein
MKTILIIDDQKRWKDIIDDCTDLGIAIENGEALVVYARTYMDGIFYLRTYKGMFAEVHIDFELGNGDTGMDVLDWLEQNPEYMPPVLSACSGHSGNRWDMHKRMQAMLAKKP